jgi:hypothetical protein
LRQSPETFVGSIGTNLLLLHGHIHDPEVVRRLANPRSCTCSGCWRNVAKEIVFLVEESDEGGFTARALGGSIFTQADSMDVLRNEVRDAVRCHFGESGGPSVIRLHHVKDEVLAA